MAWTIQTKHGSDPINSWIDWSGHQAYDDIETAIVIMLQAHKTLHARPWHLRLIDHRTGEIIPFEALGV